MKKRIIAAVLAIIVMFCFTGCGQGTGSSNGTQTQTSSKGIDGVWELKVDDEDTEILTIEGENGVYEEWTGDAHVCEIDKEKEILAFRPHSAQVRLFYRLRLYQQKVASGGLITN